MSFKHQIPEYWTIETLGDILIRADERVDPSVNYQHQHTFYIGLENIESHTGRLTSVSDTPHEELKSTKNVFHSGDILYGKLRPYLNKVYLAQEDGICSTDIWVFRTTSQVSAEYIAYYLRSPIVVGQVSQLAVGANLPRVSAISFDSISIPLPSPSEQQRIVAILRQADHLRQLRREADEKAQGLIMALFFRIFGDCDPSRKYPEGWQVIPLARLITSAQYGLSTSLESEGDIAVLRMNNISERGNLDFSDLKYLSKYMVDLEVYDLRPGDLLFNRTNSRELVGKVGLWDVTEGSYTFASYLIRVRLAPTVAPQYIWALLNSPYGKQQLFALGKQAVSMANINAQELGTIPIVLPPPELQERFVQVYRSFKAQKQLSNKAKEPLELLFQSLLSRAFSGELTATWREQHRAEVEQELLERSQRVLQDLAPKHLKSDAWLALREQRPELLAALSEEQRELLRELLQMQEYFTLETIKTSSGFSYHAIRQGLQLFSQMGLIQAVRLPDRPTQGVVVYVLAYRALTEADQARELDMDMLQREIQSRELGFDYTEEEEIVS